MYESGHVWMTARPGYEFQFGPTVLHEGGGSHGSLHALDSLSPLIVAGAPASVELPHHPRSVDIVPLIMEVLGLSTLMQVDASHYLTRKQE